MPHGMTKMATTRMTTPQQEEESSSIAFYSSRRLKLYTPAEIEHCESSHKQNNSLKPENDILLLQI
jgi:hypothetical protein